MTLDEAIERLKAADEDWIDKELFMSEVTDILLTLTEEIKELKKRQ